MKDSIFDLKKSAIPTKKFSLTLPTPLLDEIEQVKETLKEVAPDHVFNINAICVSALQTATKRAKKELDALKPESEAEPVTNNEQKPATASPTATGFMGSK